MKAKVYFGNDPTPKMLTIQFSTLGEYVLISGRRCYISYLNEAYYADEISINIPARHKAAIQIRKMYPIGNMPLHYEGETETEFIFSCTGREYRVNKS
jgi:hypothetical protein